MLSVRIFCLWSLAHWKWKHGLHGTWLKTCVASCLSVLARYHLFHIDSKSRRDLFGFRICWRCQFWPLRLEAHQALARLAEDAMVNMCIGSSWCNPFRRCRRAMASRSWRCTQENSLARRVLHYGEASTVLQEPQVPDTKCKNQSKLQWLLAWVLVQVPCKYPS